jgi:hypothetical protein
MNAKPVGIAQLAMANEAVRQLILHFGSDNFCQSFIERLQPVKTKKHGTRNKTTATTYMRST